MGKLIGAAVTLLLAPVLLLAAAAAGVLGAGEDPAAAGTGAAGGAGQPVASIAAEEIPAGMLVLYQRAATAECERLPWTVLAAVGKVESDHGRSTLPGVDSGSNDAGAQVIYGSLPAVGT